MKDNANHGDSVDRLLDAWRRVRPDLDPSPLDTVGRVIVLADHLHKAVEAALAVHDLTLGQFDILATLRRHESLHGGGLTPDGLLGCVMLTSGGMTNRLDRLAKAGLLQRAPNPSDRRSVIVTLTAKGRRLIDKATATRFQQAEDAQPPLNGQQTRQLIDSLRKWLRHWDDRRDGANADW
jgi:DNA-binding MarR family transcriptional regulator